MAMKYFVVSAFFAAAAVLAYSGPHDAMGNPIITKDDGATLSTSFPAAATATNPDSAETTDAEESLSRSSAVSSAASSSVSSGASSSRRATASASGSRPSSSIEVEEEGKGNGAAGTHFSVVTIGAIAGVIAYAQL
ncbi:hypothetical protein IWQ61_000430 [Dispira simplex]|nr:hypothetical protein IWQ61_000430 [Dispira simplex]